MDEFYDIIAANTKDPAFNRLSNLTGGTLMRGDEDNRHHLRHSHDDEDDDFDSESAEVLLRIIAFENGQIRIEKTPDLDSREIVDFLEQLTQIFREQDDDSDDF